MSVKKDFKAIEEWGTMRHPDPKFTETAKGLYFNLSDSEKKAFISEVREYILAVKSGRIIPSIPKIPIRIFKNKK